MSTQTLSACSLPKGITVNALETAAYILCPEAGCPFSDTSVQRRANTRGTDIRKTRVERGEAGATGRDAGPLHIPILGLD